MGESEYGLSAAVTTSALSEFVIADDAFTDGGRSDGADTGDLEWAKPTSNTNLLVANDNVLGGGNALKLEGQATSVEALTPALPQATTLGTTVGSTIQFSMNVRAEALADRDTGLRVGLYQQQGTLVTGDATYANSKNDKGYFATFGTGSVSAVAIYKEAANAGDSLAGGAGITLMTPVGTTTPVQINDTNDSHLILFKLTRIADGGVRVSASVDGIERVAADDATPVAETFDLLAVRSAETKLRVAVDNVSVISNPLASVQAPTGLTITNKSQYGFALTPVALAWNAAAGATGYRIERKLVGTTAWTTLGDVGASTTSFADTTAADGAAYTFRVSALDGTGATAGLNVGPATALAPEGDADWDGRTNQQEADDGTDPSRVDTDNDGLPDWFERLHNMNALSSDENNNGIPDGQEDPDGDGSTNENEALDETDPFATDSDGDGVNDLVEGINGSNPLSASDEGLPPPADMVGKYHLVVGDPSWSNSEAWIMKLKPQVPRSPVSGTVAPTVKLSAPFGVIKEGDKPLEAGYTYDVTVNHNGTRPTYLATHPDGPSFDWKANITSTGSSLSFKKVDTGMLFRTYTQVNNGPTNFAANQTSKIHVFMLDADVDSLNDSGFNVPVDNRREDIAERTTGKIVEVGAMISCR